MSNETLSFASDPIGFGRDNAPAATQSPAESPEKASAPAAAATQKEPKPSKLKSAGNAFADLLMAIGVFITGGIFGFIGYRKASFLRLSIETLIVAVVAAGIYCAGQSWLFPDGAASFNIEDPLHRGLVFVGAAILLAYAGGIVVHRGWHWKGDPKVAMLVLAVGMTLIGLRITSVGLALGEIRIAAARVDAGEAGLTALKATVEIMKENGIDPKPVGRIILDFQKGVYGSSVIESYYATVDGPRIRVDAGDLETSPKHATGDSVGNGMEGQDGQVPTDEAPAALPGDVGAVPQAIQAAE